MMYISHNVLYITPWFPTAGIDPRCGFIHDSISAVTELGVNARIMITTSWKPGRILHIQDNTNIDTYRYLSIPRYYLRLVSNWSYILRFSRIITQLIKQHNINLIHAHTEICGLIAVRIGAVLRMPTVVTVHGIETCHRFWAGMAGKMIEHMLRNASQVVVVCEPLLKFFQSLLVNMDHF